MQSFQNQVAVVTGSASGIGKALARALLQEGAQVVLADVNPQALDAALAEFRADGHQALAVATDVSQPAQLERLAVHAYREFGKVDILCNNAAVTHGGPATWENSLEDWQRVLGINLMGVVHGVKSFVPRMIKQGTPAVVLNTSAVLGITLGTTNAAYPVSKHAVVVLSECLFNEFRRQNLPISVHVLCPGFVDTNILESTDKQTDSDSAHQSQPLTDQAEAYQQWFVRQHRQGMAPEEVARLALEGIRNDKFYILTHSPLKRLVEYRMQAIIDELIPTDEFFIAEHAQELGFETPPPRPDQVGD